ncbi:hypothetical protein BD770DRAFT_414778 [Pilaira anomala]|nr:hypothetical protein BD770DRAFT_414778 [Pilaira anomala]
MHTKLYNILRAVKITPEHKKSLISEHDCMIYKALVDVNIVIKQVKKTIASEKIKVAKINYQDARNWFWKNPISLEVENAGYRFINEDPGYLTLHTFDQETKRLSSLFFFYEGKCRCYLQYQHSENAFNLCSRHQYSVKTCYVHLARRIYNFESFYY